VDESWDGVCGAAVGEVEDGRRRSMALGRFLDTGLHSAVEY
jgi:hypothetical protein